MKSAAVSHQGMVRSNNEDRYLVMESHDLLAVADGMGGHNAGEIASGIVVDSLRHYFEHWDGLSELSEAIREAVLLAGSKVMDYGRKNPKCRDMGTTLVLLKSEGEEWIWAHAGDSRGYLFRDGKLQQITQDHSMVAEMLRTGAITPEQAQISPFRHMITRALGTGEECEPEFTRIAARPEDVVLLCSDGLTDMLTDAEIEAILLKTGSLKKKAQELMNAALDAGGQDNVTILLGQKPQEDTV